MPDEPEVLGLLALMLLHDARRDARLDAERPSSCCWPTRTAGSGTRSGSRRAARVLERALPLRRPGPYQLQAAIASLHLEDGDGLAADRRALRAARQLHAVAGGRAEPGGRGGHGRRAGGGLALIDRIDGLDDYRHLHSARADLLRRLGREEEAAAAYGRALELRAAARRARVPGAQAGRSTILGVKVEAKLYGCRR